MMKQASRAHANKSTRMPICVNACPLPGFTIRICSTPHVVHDDVCTSSYSYFAFVGPRRFAILVA